MAIGRRSAQMATANQPRELRGIVRRADPKRQPTAGDVQFAPDYTVTSTTDGGGTLLTNVEVILCFWGSFWSKTPAPTPSSDDYKTAIEGILAGPFMGRLRQYRGIAQGTLIYSEINDSTDPANGYTDSDVVAMLKNRFQNTSMPAPATGHNRFYAVIVPPGVNNSLTQFAGQHQSFTYNGAAAWYAWVDNTGSLTGHNCVTKVFSHELVEACTNPNVDTSNNGILVNGTKADGTNVTNDEIGDTCNNQFGTADMNGVQCSVQSYWSKADNACILPLGTLSFWTDKSTFGKDEVQDVITTGGGKFEKAFWLVVEGFSKNTFASLAVSVPLPTGPFANLTGVSIAQNPDIDYENGADPAAQQRIRIGFDITFSNAALADFPAAGSQVYALAAFITTHGNKVPGTDASTEFELVAGADPYFTNIDPTQNNVFYLSQDLRVFTATPGQNATPVQGGPGVPPAPSISDSVAGASSYIRQLLAWLNANYSNPSGPDPFTTILPGQAGAFQGDSSVTPFTFDFSNLFVPLFFNNYNFAIARVRLRGHSGPPPAQNVRVLFRLWSTETPDTDYQTGSTYPFTPDVASLPGSPLVGTDHVTLPFFATGNVSGNTDYAAGGVNNQDIQINAGDSIWVYYGCFLNLYDGSNLIDGKPVQQWLNGTHHCLVAQIAYDGAPVVPGTSPETSDKLAQRNLQVTRSDNPGPAATHRIPQTFDLRPTGTLGGQWPYPDELMIDWGAVPPGSVASIYWPDVNAADVLALASQLYPTHALRAADANTIECKVTGGVTYVPIPARTGANFAGLFTMQLPPTVLARQEFDIIVRRVATRQTEVIQIQARAAGQPTKPAVAQGALQRPPQSWRYVIGTFQVKIPVATGDTLLFPEENTLAIMKWRLQQLSPSNRWHPVLERYVSYIAGRVQGLGGDPGAILPSPKGVPPKPRRREREFTGMVCEVLFDCFGDLEGFVLCGCCNERLVFKSRERGIGEIAWRACKERLQVSVYVDAECSEVIRKLVVRC
jgi:hypothetical protein